MVRWVVGSILHGVDTLSYFSFQPVLLPSFLGYVWHFVFILLSANAFLLYCKLRAIWKLRIHVCDLPLLLSPKLHSSQCSTTGVTKAVVCAILSQQLFLIKYGYHIIQQLFLIKYSYHITQQLSYKIWLLHYTAAVSYKIWLSHYTAAVSYKIWLSHYIAAVWYKIWLSHTAAVSYKIWLSYYTAAVSYKIWLSRYTATVSYKI